MIKNKIITILLTLFILIPIAVSENANSTKTVTYNNCKSFIDSNIELSKNHIPLLKQSILQIDDTHVKEFIKQIIKTIDKKNQVNKNDIKKIINNLNIENKIKGIHFLCLINSNGIGYGYARGIIPFIFESLFYELLFSESFLGPCMFVEWKSPDGNTKINGKKIYDEPHNGYIIGFLGFTWSDGIWPVLYRVLGLSSLVIITDYNYN